VSPELNGLEALMWRAEADPRLRSPLTVIEVLDRVPDWNRLHAAHDWGSRMVPRFRQRVVEPPLGLGAPVWELDPEFDLANHLRRDRLAPPGDLRALLDLAAELASAPFDRDRPPWEAVLVEGLERERAAYILKLHHSATDGLGGVQLLDMLHSDRREPSPEKPQPALPVASGRGGAPLLVAQLARTLGGVPGEAVRAGRDVLGIAAKVAARPRATVGEAARFARSLEQLLAEPAEPSPLLEPRSLKWRFEALDVPLSDLRAGGKAAGGTVNDAFIAALLGAFGRYHEAFGVAIEAIPMAIPVSLRRAEDPLGGNRITALRFAAPVAEADPARRIRLVHELVARKRSDPAVEALGLIVPMIGRLPAPLLSRLAGRLTQSNDLQASNVPGITRPVYIAGARITHVYPFGPLPGCAAMITLVSHEGNCCIGANLDAAAFVEPELFEACLHDGFAEVLSVANA
jgi:WS/DGAT/MGAT family acyltransferase